MKQTLKKMVVLFCVAVLTVCSAATVCYAAGSAPISSNKTNAKVGDSITLTVNANANGTEDPIIWGVEGTMNYDKSKLRFESSSATATDNGGSITFAADAPGNSARQLISFTFTVIAEGNAAVSTNNLSYSGDKENSKYSLPNQSVTIKATSAAASSSATSKTSSVTSSAASSNTSSENTSSAKSSNANLTSLKVSGGTLSPVFSAGVTSYTVQVLYDVEKTSLTATAADDNAKIDGTGNVELSVGDNPKTVTVTAEDGTKKTYRVNICRLNEGEIIEDPASGEPTATDPLAVSLDGAAYHVVAQTTLSVPEGLSVTTGEYNGIAISVFSDESGTLTVYELKNDTTDTSEYYTYRSDRDEFRPLRYLKIGSAMYIFTDEPGEYDPPEGFCRTAVSIGNGTVDAYASNDERMTDFYTVYCFKGGKFGYYRYDSAENVMQRCPDFAPVEHIDTKDVKTGNFLQNMDSRAKLILLVCAVAGLLIVVLIVLLIVMLVRRRRESMMFDPDGESEGFIGRNRDMFRFDDDLPMPAETQLNFQTKPEDVSNENNE